MHIAFPRPAGPYRLHYLGEPALRATAAAVPTRDAVPSVLIAALREACAAHSAIGLAAQHLGGTDAVIVVTVAGVLTPMINPVIVEASDESTVAPEASVSMPGFTIPVRRATRVTVTYRDEAFVSHTRTLDGWDARCLQHELDHLEGRLLIDHPGTTRQQRRHAERMAAADLERNTRRSR